MKRIVAGVRAGHVPTILGSALLLAQLASVVHSQFVDERFFSWAPHTTMVNFRIHTSIDGRELTPGQVRARYGLRWSDSWEAHAAANLFKMVERHERLGGQIDHASVWIEYTVNGSEPSIWRLEPHR